MCFLLKSFIELLTFKFEIVEPTVTPEEAKKLEELIESLMKENTENGSCKDEKDCDEGTPAEEWEAIEAATEKGEV